MEKTLIMKIKLIGLVLLTLSCMNSHAAYFQDPDAMTKQAIVNCNCKPPAKELKLQFKSNGQLLSVPPEIITQGQNISAGIILDDGFWLPRINNVISSWIKILENLNNFSSLNPVVKYGLTSAEINPVKEEYAEQLYFYVENLPTTIISTEQKEYYKTKIKLLGITIGNSAPATPNYAPKIQDLIMPNISISYRFFDLNGLLINTDGSTGEIKSPEKRNFCPCGNDIFATLYRSSMVTIPDGCQEMRYELRIDQNQNIATMAWGKNSKFPDIYKTILSDIKKAFTDDLLQSVAKINVDLKKLQKNPKDKSVDLKLLRNSIDDKLKIVDPIYNQLKIKDPIRTSWLLSWQWLTGGIVTINPFDLTTTIIGTTSGKTSLIDKSRYEIFDNMLNKGVIKLNNTMGLDTTIRTMAALKASIATDAALTTNEPKLSDRLLYSGLLKCSPKTTGNLYMRHLDLTANYMVMGTKPLKEINELERMYILIENKPVPLKLSITLTTDIPTNDNSAFTINTGGLADEGTKKMNQNIDLPTLMADAERLIKYVGAIKNLSTLPTVPLFFEKDQTPDLMTQNLEHNYLVDLPTVATYSIKTPNPDDTEKEVAKGTYRINKLYRFRFKAGVIYSALRKKDYTQNTGTGQFTLDDPQSGIDGTFGVQVYLGEKQDLRSEQIKIRPFFYTGFSMKKISENFYFGIGSEPIGGLAFALNAHLGKHEGLIGTAGQPTGIRQTWGLGIGGSIMIDAALFIKIFSFGSHKTLLGF